MKIKKVKMYLGIMMIILFTVNWMFLTPDRLQWGGLFNKFPIVKYKVNPTMIGFNTGSKESILDIIRSAGNLWSFQSGECHFKLSYNGTTTSTPVGYDQMGCTEEAKQTIRELDNIVYASNVEDDDCAGQACTYIWSCEDKNEILHFDMQINASGYEWDMGTNHKKSYNLFTVVANQFGQLLGLSHCATGESEADCQAKVARQGTSNPTSDSLLYKFIEPEVIRTAMSADDKAGLAALYGSLTDQEQTILLESKKLQDRVYSICNPCLSPLVETGIYKPSLAEQAAWQEYIEDRSNSGLETYAGKLKIFSYYQNSYIDSYRIGKVSAEDYMLDALDRRDEFLKDLPTEYISNSRKSLYVDILNLERGLNEYKKELDTMYFSFLDLEYKSLIIIRKSLIEEEVRR